MHSFLVNELPLTKVTYLFKLLQLQKFHLFWSPSSCLCLISLKVGNKTDFSLCNTSRATLFPNRNGNMSVLPSTG